jgi:oxalate decarboxylase/phosphoglucose isomerase-like protein (cupin superfamily)
MFHIRSGSLHHIENLGAERAELLAVFSDESPEDFSLHGAFGAMSDAVLGNAPRAYPHQIEVLGDAPIGFCVFFDQPTPGDIGYRASASAFSPRVPASVFGVAEADLPRFPFTPVDPLIVPRENPLDPVG